MSLIFGALASLDGYVNDANGHFDWAQPDPAVHQFVNDLQRPIGTWIYGRRLYEVMIAWETLDSPDLPDYMRDYSEIWRSSNKIVVSNSLKTVSSARTRLVPSLSMSALGSLVENAGHDVGIGGPTIAADAVRAGLIDEFQLFISPVIVGGGTRLLPPDASATLHLTDQRTFGNGVVFARYSRVPKGVGTRASID